MPITLQELTVALKAMQPGEKKVFYLVEHPSHPDLQMILMFAVMHHGKTMIQNIDYGRKCIEIILSED